QRTVQDRMHPHHHLPRRTLQDALRRRVRDRRLGRLVQQPAPPQLTGHDPPGRVRGAPLRGPQPRARPRKVAAENPGRFTILDTGTTPVPRERFRLTITVPALTLLGIENTPGLLDGIHPIPPQMTRQLAGSENTWHRVLTDPTPGAFLPLPADRYVPTPEMLQYLRLTFPVSA